MLKILNIEKSFNQANGSRLVVLKDINLIAKRGEFISITGASGSGKSTLLHLIGNLDLPDSGKILYENKNIFEYSSAEKSFYRNKVVGFIYQFHYLLPELNVLENISMPFLLDKFDKNEAFSKSKKLLMKVGLQDKVNYFPEQLSGGERQRIAILRSLINEPDIILADEPTGNLDIKTGEMVFNLFKDLVKEFNLTAIVVTHNEELARTSDKIYRLEDGILIS